MLVRIGSQSVNTDIVREVMPDDTRGQPCILIRYLRESISRGRPDTVVVFDSVRARDHAYDEFRRQTGGGVGPPDPNPVPLGPPGPQQNPPTAAVGFEALALAVGNRRGAKVVFPSQTDSAFMWRSFGVHPLQPLETTHQRLVAEAGERAPNPDARMEVEREMLDAFFPFGVDSPAVVKTRMLGGVDPAGESFDEQLRSASRCVQTVRKLCRERRGRPRDDELRVCKQQLIAEALPRIQRIVGEFERIRAQFAVNLDRIPILAEAQRLAGLVDVRTPDDWSALGDALEQHLRPLLRLLQQMLVGLCSIQTFHVIRGFYLYRLLVRFRIESNDEIAKGTKSDVSADLTGLLNDAEQWVINWLEAKMVDIDQSLNQALGNEVAFHLKGGRALEYLRRQPAAARNDWDTSVLLDPQAPAIDWYRRFSQIHNLLLDKLAIYKREFFVLCHAHTDANVFTQELPPLPDDPPENDDDEFLAWQQHMAQINDDDEDGPSWPLFGEHRAGCKAELIDIGIPRRDTVEAIEHWHKTRVRIIRRDWTNDVPIPSHLYYIDEYIMMVRDAFHSPMAKAVKRIRRLYSVLDLDPGVDNDQHVTMVGEIARIRAAMPQPLFAPILDALGHRDDVPRPIMRMLLVQLHQFMSAYDLRQRTALAQAFNAEFIAQLANMNALVQYPASLRADIQKATDQGNYDANTHGLMLRWIGFVDAVAGRFEQHFWERAHHFGFGWAPEVAPDDVARRKILVELVRRLYAPFSARDELEVQLAVTGSFAAHLHADYAMPHVPQELAGRLKGVLDPVTCVELRLFAAPGRNLSPAMILEGLVRPQLLDYVNDPQTPNLGVDFVADDGRGRVAIRLAWHEDAQMGALRYRPMVARITVVDDQWPRLAFVWGLPVLSLPDLISDYRHSAGEAEEFLATERLKQAIELLTALQTG